MKRRNVLKQLAMIPLAGSILGKESVLAETPKGFSKDFKPSKTTQINEVSTVASFMAADYIFRSIGVL